jgi:DNA-binding transcriptional MocR family regulator
MSSGLSKGRNAPKPAEAVPDRGVVEAPAEDHPVPAVRLYQQIADLIAASILDGTYKPGSRLPSERDLSEQLQVSRQTIREALIALEIRDFINVHHGSGIYVNKKPPSTLPPLNWGSARSRSPRRGGCSNPRPARWPQP